METQGTGGGRLSYRLVLTARRLSTRRRLQLVCSGLLRQMPMLRQGVFRPREIRTSRFTVLFPESGPSMDDRYQRAATSLQFTWYAPGSLSAPSSVSYPRVVPTLGSLLSH